MLHASSSEHPLADPNPTRVSLELEQAGLQTADSRAEIELRFEGRRRLTAESCA